MLYILLVNHQWFSSSRDCVQSVISQRSAYSHGQSADILLSSLTLAITICFPKISLYYFAFFFFQLTQYSNGKLLSPLLFQSILTSLHSFIRHLSYKASFLILAWLFFHAVVLFFSCSSFALVLSHFLGIRFLLNILYLLFQTCLFMKHFNLCFCMSLTS